MDALIFLIFLGLWWVIPATIIICIIKSAIRGERYGK